MVVISLQKKLKDTAYKLLAYASNQKIFLLEGPVGAGKTTLIKQLCNLLGTVDLVNSPTFSLINEYQTVSGRPIYHFDCYRMSGINEAIALDFESYFASGYYCFIEWASKIESIWPCNYLLVNIKINSYTIRNLICKNV